MENEITTFRNSSRERFHSRIFKNIIGAHKRAPSIATLTEMGRYPISIEIHKRMIRYLLRFKTIQKNRLVYKDFIEQQKVKTHNKYVSQKLEKNGYSYIFKRQINILCEIEKQIWTRKLSKFKKCSLQKYDEI